MHKNIRSISTLLIVLVSCAVIFGIIKLGQKIAQSSNPGIKVKADDITSIKIDAPTGSYTFKKEGLWKVAVVTNSVTGEYYPCDQKLMANLVTKIQNIKLTDMVSENESRWKEFQVALPEGVKVEFTAKGRQTSFFLGRFGYDQQHFYFRFDGKKQTWLSAGMEQWVCYGTLDLWRDKTLLSLDKNKLEQIEIINYTKKPKETILLKKTSDYWEIQDKGSFRKVNNTNTIGQIVNTASSLDGDEYAGPSDKIHETQYKINIKAAGITQPIELNLGDLLSSKFLIKKNDNTPLMRIYDYKINCFKKTKTDF